MYVLKQIPSETQIKKYIRRAVFGNNFHCLECKSRNCIALSVCGGGCPFSADERNGSIWKLDDVFCVHAKKTIEFLIKDLILQTIT